MQKVVLKYGTSPGWIALREISGHDEESIAGSDSESAIALIDRLLVDAPGVALRPGEAARLTIPDRDRLLAVVARSVIGPRVESTVRCAGCAQSFDLDFLLSDLLASLDDPAAGEAVEGPHGQFRLPDGRSFRLPQGLDERAVAGEPAGRAERLMLQRCMVEGSADDDPDRVTAAMREVGPLIDLEVEGVCPECALSQPVRFDLQHYLFTRLREEGRMRALEIHRIARAYRWSLREILELTRARRRLHFAMIERDDGAVA